MATSGKSLPSGKHTVDATFVTLCSLGEIASVPRDDVASVAASEESVTYECLGQDRFGSLATPACTFLGLDHAFVESHEADLFHTGGNDHICSWVEVDAENLGSRALAMGHRSDRLARLSGLLLPIEDGNHLVVIHG